MKKEKASDEVKKSEQDGNGGPDGNGQMGTVSKGVMSTKKTCQAASEEFQRDRPRMDDQDCELPGTNHHLSVKISTCQ